MPFGGMLTAGAIMGGASILGGVIGNIRSGKDRRAAEEAQKKALAEIEAIGAGPDLAKQIMFRQFESAGVLTPEVEKAIELQAPKVSQIKEDIRFKDAQMRALQALQQRGMAGFTPEEQFQLRQQEQQAQRGAESKRQQILAEMRARGAGDSGAAILAQMQGADALAAQQSEAAGRAAATASERALQAITQAGTLGGQIRGQEFDIARTKAAAEDEMSRFNVQQQIARQQRNIERQTGAQQFNLQQQQAIMNANIQQQNAELLRQRQAQQQMYENQKALAGMRAGAYSAEAQQAQQRAAQTQQAWAQGGQAIGQIGGAMAAYGMPATSAVSGAAGASGPSLGVVPKTATGSVDFGLDQNLIADRSRGIKGLGF